MTDENLTKEDKRLIELYRINPCDAETLLHIFLKFCEADSANPPAKNENP